MQVKIEILGTEEETHGMLEHLSGMADDPIVEAHDIAIRDMRKSLEILLGGKDDTKRNK